MLDQDIKDRRQIGLFGQKKNSEILGTNQGAYSNNYAGKSVENGSLSMNTKRNDGEYNTLFVDKNCASCHGFAPQVLNQIKIACLSYVNSPI